MLYLLILLLALFLLGLLLGGALRAARVRRERGGGPLILIDRRAAIWITVLFVAVVALIGWFAIIDTDSTNLPYVPPVKG